MSLSCCLVSNICPTYKSHDPQLDNISLRIFVDNGIRGNHCPPWFDDDRIVGELVLCAGIVRPPSVSPVSSSKIFLLSSHWDKGEGGECQCLRCTTDFHKSHYYELQCFRERNNLHQGWSPHQTSELDYGGIIDSWLYDQ